MTRCHCGRPLHYDDPHVLAFHNGRNVQHEAERLIELAGGDPYVPVTQSSGRTWLVQRHYIALHRITDTTDLTALGFQEIT